MIDPYDIRDLGQFLVEIGPKRHIWKAWQRIKARLEEADSLEEKLQGRDEALYAFKEFKKALDQL